jgi:S-adenosylmethionine hydrolase
MNKFVWLAAFLCTRLLSSAQNQTLVFQTDFGVKDGAVAAMKGVARSVSSELDMFDITHEISAFNIAEAAYRLNQAAPYWPAGTVFVSVVDPGVGSDRKAIVLKTKTGHYFISPDNGTLTLVAESMGIEAVRVIDPKLRKPGSDASYTFHGRDVFAYAAAHLASRKTPFEKVGPLLSTEMIKLPDLKASAANGVILGSIPVLDIQYGNVWTNIDASLLREHEIKPGTTVNVKITHDKDVVFEGKIPFVNTFADVKEGETLGYLNSLLQFSVAINQGNFAKSYQVSSGEGWRIQITKEQQR